MLVQINQSHNTEISHKILQIHLVKNEDGADNYQKTKLFFASSYVEEQVYSQLKLKHAVALHHHMDTLDWTTCAHGRWLHEVCAEECITVVHGKKCSCPFCLDVLTQNLNIDFLG